MCISVNLKIVLSGFRSKKGKATGSIAWKLITLGVNLISVISFLIFKYFMYLSSWKNSGMYKFQTARLFTEVNF